jgi:hypothetical protein
MSKLLAKDIVAIIEACGKSGVTSFKCGELELRLGETHEATTVPRETIDEQVIQEEKPTMMTEMDREELKVQMMIDDPLALEEMVMRGDNQA